jgi:hypothetical protein
LLQANRIERARAREEREREGAKEGGRKVGGREEGREGRERAKQEGGMRQAEKERGRVWEGKRNRRNTSACADKQLQTYLDFGKNTLKKYP